jgi:hypothetical protein
MKSKHLTANVSTEHQELVKLMIFKRPLFYRNAYVMTNHAVPTTAMARNAMLLGIILVMRLYKIGH